MRVRAVSENSAAAPMLYTEYRPLTPLPSGIPTLSLSLSAFDDPIYVRVRVSEKGKIGGSVRPHFPHVLVLVYIIVYTV